MTTTPPVNQRGSVKAMPAETFDTDRVPAGHSEFCQGDKSLLFGCPCGCGDLRAVDLEPGEGRRPRWQWDGNRERPTLTPSILNYQMAEGTGERIGEHWHGFLTAGEFRSC